jgi:hypothetical protein
MARVAQPPAEVQNHGHITSARAQATSSLRFQLALGVWW